MALRSLAVKLKGLPRRLSGSGSLDLKDDPRSKISAALAKKYGSIEEVDQTVRPLLEQQIEFNKKRLQNEAWVMNTTMVLVTIFGFGSMGYIVANIVKRAESVRRSAKAHHV